MIEDNPQHEYERESDRSSATNARDGLTSTSPEKAVRMYLDAKEGEVVERTHSTIKYRLGRFTDWCERESIEDTTQLTGRLLYEYRLSLQNDDLSPYTIQQLVSTVRAFVRFCERIDAVQGGLSDKVLLPEVSREEKSRDTILPSERAEDIREHLRKYEWASRDHVIFETLWHVGMRVGGLRALDVKDFDEAKQVLRLQHRPSRETTLKNGTDGERPVALSDTVTEVISDYIGANRTDVTDEYGRAPLVTTDQGRASTSVLKRTVTRVTVPCMVSSCPHGKSRDSCDWTVYNKSYQCPSSRTPHEIRRGRITHLKSQRGLPNEVITDRTNVSEDVLENHYDKRDPDTKMEMRREYLDELDL